jgi:hypothetical protein
MWTLFRKSRLLSAEDEYFQTECYRWLLKHFGGDDFYKETALVLPTHEFFPEQVDSQRSAAESTFRTVLRHAKMADWPVELVEQESDPDVQVGESLLIQNVTPGPQGTFSVSESNKVYITYNPAITNDPESMVATFAHEIAHYLTAGAPEPPPGGWDNWEFATDIAATFIGFGIFQANSAFRFRQFSGAGTSGWQSSRSGYLTEAEHSYALAIFLRLKSIDPNVALPWCGKNISSYLKKALSVLDASDAIKVLRDIEPTARNR